MQYYILNCVAPNGDSEQHIGVTIIEALDMASKGYAIEEILHIYKSVAMQPVLINETEEEE